MGSNANALYRFFDAKGVLLYVGITKNPQARFSSHRSTKPWWDYVAEIKIEQFNNRTELALAELKAIQSEQPKYNLANLQPVASSSRRVTHLSRDANRFGTVESEPPRDPRVSITLRCQNCRAYALSQAATLDGKPDRSQPVICGRCDMQWTYETWKEANLGLPKL